MRYYTLLAVLFSAVLFIGGCKKKDDPSLKDVLSSHSWKVTAHTSDPALVINGTNYGTDVFSQLAIYKTCVKDNLFYFESNGNYRIEEGASKCNDTDPVINESGTWTLTSDEKTLSTTANGQRTEYTILEKSSDKIIASYLFVNGGVSYKQTITFSK